MTVGKPNSENYSEVAVDNYRVFFFKEARTEQQVVIDAPGFGMFRKLQVAGIIV